MFRIRPVVYRVKCNVRHTAEGFPPIVVREAVGDRVPGVVEWNLFGIDAKFGGIVSVETTLAYLSDL
jgi:N-carbamoylsarcosine amidase